MSTVVVTDKALREMVREAMWNKDFAGWSANHDEPVIVNSSVDPSISVTDPVNPNFTPQSKTEFAVAVNQLVKNLPDEEMSQLFNVVKTAIDQKETQGDEEDMDKKAAQGGTTQVEEAVRKSIRKILADIKPRVGSKVAEAGPFWGNRRSGPRVEPGPVVGPLPPVTKIPPGVHGGEYSRRIEKNKNDLRKGLGKAVDTLEKPVVDDEDLEGTQAGGEAEAPETTAAAGKRRTYKSTALGGMEDVGGKSFEEIAKELDFSVAGAKQAVDKALEKAQFLASMDEDDREILVLSAMNDYIKYLSKSGELSPADVQLMKDHPDVVRELEGFREFLHNHVRRIRKADQKLINPVKDEDEVVATPDDLADVVGEQRRRKPPVLVSENTAARVSQKKKKNPELYCPKCLWMTGGGACPRHGGPAWTPEREKAAKAKARGEGQTG